MNVPKSAITLLVESIKGSERMRGVTVQFGARAEPEGGAPCRIVLTPTSETHEPPESNDNVLDAVIAFEGYCWGESFDVVRYLRGALILCCRDFQIATDSVRVTFVGAEHSPAPDTAQDGWELTINFTIRDFVDKTPLAANAGSALVDNVQLAPGAGSVGPTVTYPP